MYTTEQYEEDDVISHTNVKVILQQILKEKGI